MTDLNEMPVNTAPQTPEVPGPLPRSGPAMISMRGISKSYVEDKPALYDVNVDIGSGEFVFIVGHSGSGKSDVHTPSVA